MEIKKINRSKIYPYNDRNGIKFDHSDFYFSLFYFIIDMNAIIEIT
jgi:hypothetical protein